MKVDVLVPVHHRPHNAIPFMASLAAVTPGGAVRVTAIAGFDDLQTIGAWAQAGANICICPDEPGSFAQRVNYGYRRTYRPFLFLAGDDVHFHEGWLDALELQYVATGAKVIGTNDLGNGAVMAGEHATHMLIERAYVAAVGASWDGPGIVCHEGYRHCYVDDEIVTAAKQRGVWSPCLDSVVEHLHPSWHKSEVDSTYAIGIESMGNDGLTFKDRLAAHS